MSDEFDADENENSGKGMKSLREALEKANAEREALAKELASFRQEKRQATVAEVLQAKGINPKAARLYNGEDASEDAVGKWVAENADIFGVPNPAPADGTDQNAQNAARLAAAAFGQPAASTVAPGQPVLGSVDEIARSIKDLPYEELVKNFGFPKREGLGY